MIDSPVSVTDSPTLVVPAGGTAGLPVRVYLYTASGADPIAVGGPDVDGSTHGYILYGGDKLELELIGEALYAYTDSGETLYVLATGVEPLPD